MNLTRPLLLFIASLVAQTVSAAQGNESAVPAPQTIDKNTHDDAVADKPDPAAEQSIKTLESRSLQEPNDPEIWFQLGLATAKYIAQVRLWLPLKELFHCGQTNPNTGFWLPKQMS